MNGWVGKTLGKVQIESLIARGGVAEVYLGTHTALQRKVAVKILREQYEDDPNLLERFQREAVVVSRLRHPNIVQIYDYDTVAGHPYLVMEYISGPSLSRYLDAFHAKGKRLDLSVISRLLTSVASALEYAHKMGVIHRDVKPANILLTSHTAQVIAGITMPTGFEPILTDFGLVRFLNSSRHTTAGQIAGTPAYMSPEQARGETTDERTDIYSLGIVLYEMLSGGRVPFEGETTMSVLLKHIHEPVKPIPDLDPSLQAVLDRALAKNRLDRYATPTEFASAFQATVNKRSQAITFVNEKPVPFNQKTERRMDLKPRRKWLPSIALGLLGIALGSLLWLRGIPNQDVGIIPETGGLVPASSSPIQAGPVQRDPAMVLRFRNGTALVDRAELIAEAMPLPPNGSQYEAWLIGGDIRQSLGVLALDDQGKGTLIYTDSNGANLIGLYDSVIITVKNVPNDNPEPSEQVVYAFTMPAEGLVHVRHLLSSSPNTPDETSITQGLITNIQAIQQNTADMKAGYESGNATDMKQNAETILNLMAGDQSPDYKDWDGDGERLDPSDGYGLLPNGNHTGYIQALYAEADAAANAPGITFNMIHHAEDVRTCAQNLVTWAPALRETMLTILSSPAGSNLDRQIADSVKFADQLGNGVDLDADQSVDLVPGECGAKSAVESSYAMAEMPLLPISLVSTATVTELSSTQQPSNTPVRTIVTPTKRVSQPESTAVPPAATKPGKRPPADKPKPTKKNP
jgi:serine/threonine protein kinase